MSKNLYVIRKGFLFVILILMFYFLTLQSASATVWEYSISGVVDFIEDGQYAYSEEITGTAFINDTKTPFYDPEDLPYNCQLAPASNDCEVRFAITYFDMNVGGEYSFTGTGFLEFNSADTLGALYGTGDFSSLFWSQDSQSSVYRAQNYEQWLAFELPTSLFFDGTGEVLEVTNPDFPENGPIGGTFQRVGPVVPAPAAVWLFGSGLIGLIGIARRKKA